MGIPRRHWTYVVRIPGCPPYNWFVKRGEGGHAARVSAYAELSSDGGRFWEGDDWGWRPLWMTAAQVVEHARVFSVSPFTPQICWRADC